MEDLETENLRQLLNGKNLSEDNLFRANREYKALILLAYEKEQENESLKKMLRFDKPWSLKAILDKLIESTTILLDKKNYDGHGWELITEARDQAVNTIKKL